MGAVNYVTVASGRNWSIHRNSVPGKLGFYHSLRSQRRSCYRPLFPVSQDAGLPFVDVQGVLCYQGNHATWTIFPLM
jgi:hypothetical protein